MNLDPKEFMAQVEGTSERDKAMMLAIVSTALQYQHGWSRGSVVDAVMKGDGRLETLWRQLWGADRRAG
jgi:hypothetical protein